MFVCAEYCLQSIGEPEIPSRKTAIADAQTRQQIALELNLVHRYHFRYSACSPGGPNNRPAGPDTPLGRFPSRRGLPVLRSLLSNEDVLPGIRVASRQTWCAAEGPSWMGS